ncbi:CHASE3 domain-containing protein [Paenibacillus methanolicus]|uniref:Circadian input-output histidine kinase CikA n=1 Tax=Paenibacillus methanolicus TaxID=582686 RepID=A0A5S5BUI2_9BACL|nr:CHASE3 domain-containing protein [Paenibacillus methanolicus]TYP70677.1 two-component system chemotaxis sensor kinase CheA [Paenibacillus methanolicus]
MQSRLRFGIRAKILTGYLAIIMCLLTSIVVLGDRLNTQQEEVAFITEHDFSVQEKTSRIEKAMLDMETGQRGFVITGNPSYLVPYDDGHASWEKDLHELYDLMEDNPAQQRRLDSIEASIRKWIETAGDPIVALQKEGRDEQVKAFFQRDAGKTVFDEVRKKFEDFRLVQQQLSDARVAELEEQSLMLRWVLLLAIGLTVCVAVALGLFTAGAITRTIRDVKEAIDEIAVSNSASGRRIVVHTNDEIRDLGEATNRLLESKEREAWLQTTQTEIVSAHQGVTDMDRLGRSFLGMMVRQTGADCGVLYHRSDDRKRRRLERLAVFAVSGEADAAPAYRLGEGLVGQCALEQRILELKGTPPSYLRIASALGEADPQHVLVAPVVFEGETIAVLELAAFRPFAATERSLLEKVIGTFGATMNGVESRDRIERLLRESQTMMEELQTQQEELRATNEQLEDRTRFAEEKSRELSLIQTELENYASELQQSSQYKSEFLANMSHELRTPLNSMLILSQMLAENAHGTLQPEEQNYARVIHEAGGDLLLLINDILDLSKVEAGKLDIHVDQMDTTELPFVMEHHFRPLAEKKRLAFAVERDPAIPDFIYSDGLRVHQIIKNLLSNAIKFTERGEVRLTLRPFDPERDADAARRLPGPVSLVVSVADTGIGIPPHMHEAVFDPFRQADGTTNRKYGGTGLGLSISRELSKLLRGHIALRSAEGSGSTFTLYLPSLTDGAGEGTGLANIAIRHVGGAGGYGGSTKPRPSASEAETAAAALQPAEAARGQFAGRSVLIVDDDVRNVFALTSALEKTGFAVKAAHDGEECLALLRQGISVDLVLMDIMMPVMDGYDAMRAIRSQPQFARLPIIALTAKAMKQDREQCLAAGASDYISKPIDMSQLLSLIQVWLVK